jgi:hypothetical protein
MTPSHCHHPLIISIVGIVVLSFPTAERITVLASQNKKAMQQFFKKPSLLGNGNTNDRMSLAAQLAAPSPSHANSSSSSSSEWQWPSFLSMNTSAAGSNGNGSNPNGKDEMALDGGIEPSAVDLWCMKWCSFLPPLPSLALTRGQRLALFLMTLSFGVLLMIMAFMLYLPRIVLGSSYKFAMCIALGNIFLLMSPLPLAGRRHLTLIFASGRLTAATAYFASLLLTLLVAFQLPSLFVVIPSLIVQVTCTIWYGLTFIPGGAAAISRLSSLLSSSLFRRTLLPI